MNSKNVILFKTIPNEFNRHKKVYVMQYEFSGIQDFIFGGITIASTQSSISERSEYIIHATNAMESWLRKKLSPRVDLKTLSKSSGKLICAVPRSLRVKKDKLYDLSDELQKIIYVSTNGTLEMFYGICEAEVAHEDEGKTKKNAMSILAKEVNRNKYHCTNTLGIHGAGYMSEEFAFHNSNQGTDDLNVNRDIMTAIKFDLDNLGSFFQKLTAFDTRKKASECLAGILNHAFDGIPGVEPVFIGGDDIFAVAPIENYLTAVSAMHKRIKTEIDTSEELTQYREVFGISAGVSFIRNDLGKVPVVYYFEQSEEKLMQAKQVSGKNVFVVSNCIMTWEQLEMLSKILTEKESVILQGLSEEQRYDLYFNVKVLKNRILSIHRNTGGNLLTEEEERNVYSIN